MGSKLALGVQYRSAYCLKSALKPNASFFASVRIGLEVARLGGDSVYGKRGQ
jgi:hypothetical protein